MQLENQPIDLAADAQDHFANDMNDLAAIRINSAHAHRAGRKKEILVSAIFQ
jgi:hypothetical protein